jgi:hypothetical protein
MCGRPCMPLGFSLFRVLANLKLLLHLLWNKRRDTYWHGHAIYSGRGTGGEVAVTLFKQRCSALFADVNSDD